MSSDYTFGHVEEEYVTKAQAKAILANPEWVESVWPDGWADGTSEVTKIEGLIGVKFKDLHPDIAEQLLGVREDEE